MRKKYENVRNIYLRKINLEYKGKSQTMRNVYIFPKSTIQIKGQDTHDNLEATILNTIGEKIDNRYMWKIKKKLHKPDFI